MPNNKDHSHENNESSVTTHRHAAKSSDDNNANTDDKNNAVAVSNETHQYVAQDEDQNDSKNESQDDSEDENQDESASEGKTLKDEDFSEGMSDEDKQSIKEVASDDNLSEPKSYASILVEQVMDAKETFERSLGSLFTSAFTAGLEIGISFFMILSAFALLSGVLPSHYAIVLASLLYPIGFIIVVIGQSLLFTEQTSLLSLPVLNGIEPLNKLLRLWGIVIAGNVVGGCLFAALMIGLGLHMQLFSVGDIDAYSEHVLEFEWWVIFGSAVLAGWMMGVAAWLVTSARDTISRIVLVSLITGSIGFLGLHHSIVGNIEVFSALLYGNTVSFWRYLIFLVIVTLGNTVGGVVFVAVLKNRTFLFEIERVKQQNADHQIARTNRRRR
ncbi:MULTISPECIES: formate/nitrite transporter family protein [Psychrobacter]|uniref:formate/nitrite transporter family protein n=1 Tax=Psychrobacter TaxID=497 RepID=UPI000C32760B|nr:MULTISPECIES: formate/nitrite transporter family protein [Psychrobacter]PKG34315.1 formate transporter [Psychrobacter sp. Sarcosine-3u-12]